MDLGPDATGALTYCALAFTFVWLAIWVTRRVGLVDKPDERKQHSGHVPLAGGLALFASLLAADVLFTLPPFGALELVLVGIVFCAGLWDDWRELSASKRLFVQLICGCLMVISSNFVIRQVGDLLGFGPIGLAVLALPLTALAFAGMANAYNMIDGLDGLAATLALVPLALLANLAYSASHPVYPTLVALMIPLLVFLLFNLGSDWRWLPKIFLGDSGSNLLGFVVCGLLIYLSQGENPLIPPVTALWLIAVPLMDMLATMLLRLREGHHPMRPDRRHLHHILQDMGYDLALTRGIIIGYALVLSGLGLLLMPLPEFVSMYLYLAVFCSHCAFVLHSRRGTMVGA
jgi:UDP-GlcNAc:undecaprenyl-phosphate/decaprenyl-phosphate GlcNAc-1-phosphate transferase